MVVQVVTNDKNRNLLKAKERTQKDYFVESVMLPGSQCQGQRIILKSSTGPALSIKKAKKQKLVFTFPSKIMKH